MTTPPFSGNDFRDQIDSVARNLTGDAFRLKQNDPDAPLKFMDFVAQSEQDFMQVQQPMSELEMLNAQAEARIADPREQLAPFSPAVGQTPASPDSPLVRALTPTRPLIDRDVAERAGRGLPLVGDVTGPIFGAASELTSPLEAALIAASAGLGAPLAGAARGIPAVGRFIAPLLEPVSGGFGRAAAAEAAAGTGAILGSEQAAEALQDAPAPIRTAGTIAGGLAGGVGGFAAPSVAGRGARAAGEAAASVGAAVERAGIPSPVSVARAAEDVGRGFNISEPRAGGTGQRFAVTNEGSKADAILLPADENGKVVGSIVDFETDPSKLRQGFGEALVRDTMKALKDRGATSFEVFAERGNSPALFGKIGFTETGVRNKFGDREMIFDLINGPEEITLPKDFNLQSEMAKTNDRFLDDLIKNEPEVAREMGLLDQAPPRGVADAFADDVPLDDETARFIGVQQRREADAARAGATPEEQLHLASARRNADIAGTTIAGGVPPANLPPIEESLASLRVADEIPQQAVQPQVADDAARLTPEQQIEADVAAAREQRRVPQTAEDIAQDTVIRPSGGISASEQLFGLSGEIDTGLTRRERAVNSIRQQLDPSKIDEVQGFRRTLGAETDPVIEPLFRERSRVIANAEKRASSVVARVMPRIKRTFDIADNGTIDSLRGIDPDLPVAPTLQDVAARLPRFLNSLTPEQRGIMEELRVFAEPYGRALRESGDDFGTRTDIMEGGFYLPRGNAANADLAIGFSRGSRRAGANISQEQSATFGSMAEGIANGWEYDAIGDAIGGLVRRSGQRVADNFTQRFLREAKNEDGQRFGLTIKELLVRDNPAIAAKFSDLTKAATRLKTLLKNKDSQAIRGLERLLADPDFDDVAEVRRVFLNSRNVLRGELKGQNVKQVRESLKALQKELAEFRTVYDKAKKSAARNAGRRQIGGAESFPQLNGVTFPERMAARANEALQQEGADLGRLSRGLAGFDAFQRIWRAANATLDNSGVGIQGLLGAAENPIRGSKVLRRNLEAGLGTKSAEVYSDWATDFNTRVGSQGRLSTDDWAGQFGLAQLGKSPDVQSGILESIPGAGRVFARADRAFAIVGDMTRAEWADDLLREELLAGKTIDQMRADGTLQQIANTVNAATGFVDGNFNLANLAMFSARFFTARILTMLRAIRGMDIDAPLDLVPYAGKNLQRKLPKVNKFSRTQDKYARRAMMRLIGYGTMLTVLANASQGRDTDFRPVVNGRPNPNFARFRAFNRDWSVFGPWDSMLRMVMNLGTGNFRDTSDSLLNAPMIAATLDLRDNERFGGEPIINQKGDFGEKSGQILQYFGEAALPFAGAEAGELIPEAQEQLTEQDWAGLGITGLTAISEGFGIKSSPLSMSELRELANNPLIDASTRAEINQEIRERQERFRKFDSPSQGQSTADRIFGGGGR